MKILTVVLALAWLPVQAQEAVIRLCYPDADNFPWHVKGGWGVSNKVIAAAATRSGIKVEQVPLPWKRCLSGVENGTLDGAFAASFNPERAAYAVYPSKANGRLDPGRRIKSESYSFYRLKGSPVTWNGKRLANLEGPVGAQLGYSVVYEMKKAGIAVEEIGPAAETYVKYLGEGYLPLVALLTREGDELVASSEYAKSIERISPPFSEKDYFAIFGKRFYAENRNRVENFWNAIAKASESPEFSKLTRARTKAPPAAE